jgi:cytochrome c oxidase assembly factor CtaG
MFAILGFGILGFMMTLLLLPLVALAFVFWIWMLIHAVTNRGLSDGEKVAWVLVVLFLHFLGAFIYFLVGRPKQLAAGM